MAAKFECPPGADCRNSRAAEEAEYRYLQLQAARLAVLEAKTYLRPCIVLGAQLESRLAEADGKIVWIASYGDCWGLGNSPDEAFNEFDRTWLNGDN